MPTGFAANGQTGEACDWRTIGQPFVRLAASIHPLLRTRAHSKSPDPTVSPVSIVCHTHQRCAQSCPPEHSSISTGEAGISQIGATLLPYWTSTRVQTQALASSDMNYGLSHGRLSTRPSTIRPLGSLWCSALSRGILGGRPHGCLSTATAGAPQHRHKACALSRPLAACLPTVAARAAAAPRQATGKSLSTSRRAGAGRAAATSSSGGRGRSQAGSKSDAPPPQQQRQQTPETRQRQEHSSRTKAGAAPPRQVGCSTRALGSACAPRVMWYTAGVVCVLLTLYRA
jgi:hypothetical protein